MHAPIQKRHRRPCCAAATTTAHQQQSGYREGRPLSDTQAMILEGSLGWGDNSGEITEEVAATFLPATKRPEASKSGLLNPEEL